MGPLFAVDCDCGLAEQMCPTLTFETDELAFTEFLRLREKFVKRARLKIDDNDDRYYIVHGPSGHIIGTTV